MLIWPCIATSTATCQHIGSSYVSLLHDGVLYLMLPVIMPCKQRDMAAAARSIRATFQACACARQHACLHCVLNAGVLCLSDCTSCPVHHACWLVQVRMQAEGKLAAGQAKKYPNAIKAYGIIRR